MRKIMRPIYIQVLLGVIIGAGLGFVAPNIATQMKPLGDLFVSLVHLLIAPLVFCTVSMGVARVSSLGHAGRIGLTALFYFLIASTFALLFGLTVGLVVQPGAGLNIDPSTLSMAGLDRFRPKEGAASGFFDMVLHMLPSNMVSPFVQGDVIQVVVLAVAALAWWLRRSAFGSILVAARDNETRTRAFGYSPYLIRLIAFVISGAMAGAMGYLTAAQHGFVAPQMLAWQNSATVLVMVLIGGKDTTSGPALGAILLLLAEEVLQRTTEHWLIGVGLIIVALVIAAPNGIVPYLAQALRSKRVQHA